MGRTGAQVPTAPPPVDALCPDGIVATRPAPGVVAPPSPPLPIFGFIAQPAGGGRAGWQVERARQRTCRPGECPHDAAPRRISAPPSSDRGGPAGFSTPAAPRAPHLGRASRAAAADNATPARRRRRRRQHARAFRALVTRRSHLRGGGGDSPERQGAAAGTAIVGGRYLPRPWAH
ncbi:homeobox protein cut-like 1 [Schistocerca americana]|uniref:homeobox protein cut-like 1 n=1 Tax=Schistocerca americana TaxID=7009 RepID=UPI001F4F495B|nr:homeobox protein cut-like 1 [Schistocerca americana]